MKMAGSLILVQTLLFMSVVTLTSTCKQQRIQEHKNTLDRMEHVKIHVSTYSMVAC